MGILLMYDVTSLESFNNLSYWLRNIQEVILIKKDASPCVWTFFFLECIAWRSENFSWKQMWMQRIAKGSGKRKGGKGKRRIFIEYFWNLITKKY